MRIHRLKLQAYGPFPGSVDLDFDELNRAGIFLLNGPTGSGKSSILDAICFALYGTTSLARPDLKSHFAPANRAPWVELDCTVGQVRLHIERSPRWERPKKRGQGSMIEHAKVLIQRQNVQGGWEIVATRSDEAGAFIADLVGLNREQFTQVMLLPQGEFARFLSSSSTDREELLKKLFSTSDFEQVQVALNDRFHAAEDRAEQARLKLQRIEDDAEAAYARTGGEELPELAKSLLTTLSLSGDRLSLRQHLEEWVNPVETANLKAEVAGEVGREKPDFTRFLTESKQHLVQVVQVLTRSQAVIEDSLNSNRAHLSKLEELARDWQEFEQLKQQKKNLNELSQHQENNQQRLSLAQAARAILPLNRTVHRAVYQLSSIQDLKNRQVQSVLEFMGRKGQRLPISLSGFDPERNDSVESALQRSRQLQQQLHDTTVRVQELAEQRTCYLESQKKLEELQQSIQQHTEHRRNIDTQLALAHKKSSRLLAQRGSLENQAEVVNRARQGVKQAEHRRALHSEYIRAVEEAEVDEQTRLCTAQIAEELQSLRYSQAAQSLAHELVPGNPCPVCGSEEHPSPVESLDDQRLIEESDVQKAVTVRNQAETKAQGSREEAGRLRALLDSLEEAGVATVEEAQQKLHREYSKLEKLEQLEHAWEKAEEHCSRLVKLQEKAQVTDHQLALKYTELTTAVETIGERIKRLEEQGAEASLVEAVEQEKTACTFTGLLDDLRSILEKTAHAQQLYQQAQADLQQALSESPFETGEQADKSVLDDSAFIQLEQEIAHYRSRLSGVNAQLESQKMQNIEQQLRRGNTAPTTSDRREIQERIQYLVDLRDRLLKILNRHVAGAEELEFITDLYRRESERTGKLVEDYLMRRSLAETANGRGQENRLAMTLTTYVLAGELKEVTQAATVHLEQMTHGRYRLVHTDERQSRGKSGLGISIFDTWHSRNRLPSTLSGGETFMASLALALGLADVVQHRNGGIEIDTLFVDEGFGSLDESTLEEVMGTLDGLRERGRVIGLISHVAEMKNRIPHHIQLATSPEGSKIVATTH